MAGERTHNDGDRDAPDPSRSRDGIVAGTVGNDLIDRSYRGDPDGDRIDAADALLPGAQPDDDFVRAGAGNDTVRAGDGNDSVLGEAGNDRLFGQDGNDTLDGGPGSDSLDGGSGNDVLLGGEGRDTLAGGSGNDLGDGGQGDDLIRLGAGDDTGLGGDGNDSIFGGAGNDLLDGGAGNDRLDGDPGQDTIFGGAGNDSVTAGEGDDLIDGGEGADTLWGQNDRDTFTNTTAGDVIDGGEGGNDFDTLDLTNWGKAATNIIYDPANRENGLVQFLDSQGNVTGSLTFKNIENIVPCFTPGTAIATPKGERAVEDLKVGDRVLTRDNGIREIRWIGQRQLSYAELQALPHLKPVLIEKGSLGNGLPERDMLVSPNHRMLVANDRTALFFEEHEVLVAAKHIVSARGVRRVDVLGVTYIHFLCDRHEVVLANGAWTESFQPGDLTLGSMGNAQRAEIYELFPELADQRGRGAYAAARRTLKRREAMLLEFGR
ncbi:MAG: Hint domain-containing protein [Paracoccaceae bacterium]